MYTIKQTNNAVNESEGWYISEIIFYQFFQINLSDYLHDAWYFLLWSHIILYNVPSHLQGRTRGPQVDGNGQAVRLGGQYKCKLLWIVLPADSHYSAFSIYIVVTFLLIMEDTS